MDSTGHRKIELQSNEDFTYLVNNVRRAADESISAAFPPLEGAEDQEDKLRVGIEELVNDFIAQTYALAAPNMSINGLPVPDSLMPKTTSATKHHQQQQQQQPKHKRKATRGKKPPAEEQEPEEEEVAYEPFDARLRDRIPDLLREEEDLLREIAALKRRVPAAAAVRVASAVKAGVGADEAALAVARERVAGAGAVERRLKGRKRMLNLGGEGEGEGEGDDGPSASSLGPPGAVVRAAEVKEAYDSAVSGLSRVKREMPVTVARMERARAAGGYVIAGS